MGRSYHHFHPWSSDKTPSKHKKIRQQANEREAIKELTSVLARGATQYQQRSAS